MSQTNPEIYLINQNRFWHSRCKSLKPIIIEVRTGELKSYQEIAHTVTVSMSQFTTYQKGIKTMSDMIEQKLKQGYYEINGDQMLKVYEFEEQEQRTQQIPLSTLSIPNKKTLTKQKIARKINLPKQEKPIIALTDDATNGKLVGEWPKFRQRTHLGETHDLGPQGGSQMIQPLLANFWSEDIDPQGYLLSEKLDGMRIIWTGCEMFTRQGNPIEFPSSFVEGWPTTYLDGELWINRGKFQKICSIARKKQANYKEWDCVKYMVFDAPLLDEPFAQRYQKFKKAIEKIKNPHLVYVPHVLCNGIEHLQKELQLAQQEGGEGLMLRDPNSLYEGKRSNTLLKVKTQMDSEATVIDHINGLGKFKECLGALKVQTDQGIIFQVGVGFNVNMRKNPPRIGSRITYKYYGLTDDGKPRHPVFDRVREDI